jgi:Domain of unknown function (DUF4062)
MSLTPPPKHLPVIRIFISSPGDVSEERQMVAAIIDRLAKTASVHDRATLQTIWYDDPLRQIPFVNNITMQEAVNRGMAKPSQCDIVVGILWGRMGTPLDTPLKPDGSQYLSGTEWEIEDALQAKVDLLIYRRCDAQQIPPSVLRDAAALTELQAQFARVDAFSDRLSRPAPGVTRAVNQYCGLEEFREAVGQHLPIMIERILADLLTDGDAGANADVQAQKTGLIESRKTEYLDMVLNQTATIRLPILSPAGIPVVAALSDLRIDLPLFVNHDHQQRRALRNE